MITSCDPINPYTITETFGVPYNGGYKPDPNLEWIPPNVNTINDEEDDDFIAPPTLPPSNMLMQTCEGKRIDPRLEIKGYKLEYDDFTTTQPLEVPSITKNNKIQQTIKTTDDERDWRLLIILIVLVTLLWLITRFS